MYRFVWIACIQGFGVRVRSAGEGLRRSWQAIVAVWNICLEHPADFRIRGWEGRALAQVGSSVNVNNDIPLPRTQLSQYSYTTAPCRFVGRHTYLTNSYSLPTLLFLTFPRAQSVLSVEREANTTSMHICESPAIPAYQILRLLRPPSYDVRSKAFQGRYNISLRIPISILFARVTNVMCSSSASHPCLPEP